MGSRTIQGVWFQVFSHDHGSAHVHGSYADVVVIVDLLPDGTVRKAKRHDAVVPANAKRSDVRRILSVAKENAATLQALWENTHGTLSK